MSFIEFIGFVISMVALIFLFSKKIFDQRRARLNPEESEREEEEQKRNLKEFLRSLEIDMEDQEQFKPPPPPPKITPPQPPKERPRGQQKPRPASRVLNDPFKAKLEQRQFETAIEKRGFKTNIEDRFYQSFDERLLSSDFRKASTDAYDVILFDQTPRIQHLVGQLPSLREMIIIREIIGPPKGLQFPDECS